MKKNGFISIIVLQLVTIISMFVLALIYNNINTLSLANSLNNKIQANIISESNINRLLHKDKYIMKYIYPYVQIECRDGFKKDLYEVKLEEDEFKYIKRDRIYVSFEDREDRKYVNIQAEIIYEGISKTIVSTNSAINKIFELGSPYINSNNLEDIEGKKFNFFLNEVQDKIGSYIKDLPEKFTSILVEDKLLEINYYNSKEVSINLENQILNNRHLILFNSKNDRDRVNLVIGDHLEKDKEITLSGVLFVEGDLIINQDLNFNGIIVIKDGDLLVEEDVSFNQEGIIIHKGDIEDLGKLNLTYKKDYINFYGIELPGFFLLQPEVIKRY